MKNSPIKIEWKVCGLLPLATPILDSKYFTAFEDKNYINRTLGRVDININVYSLTPTNLFFQALNKELVKSYGIRTNRKRFPYSIPLSVIGEQEVKFRAKLFEPDVIILTVSLNVKERPYSVKELSELQLLSNHEIVSAICRFFINVHSYPNASQIEVSGWKAMPLLIIQPSTKTKTKTNFSNNELASIVTRHEQMNDKASKELLAKNSELNFNNDQMLIDKQGILFNTITSDKIGQRNRFSRISDIAEFAQYIKSLEKKGQTNPAWRTKPEIASLLCRVDELISSKILNQSVSAKRGWHLIREELDIKSFNVEMPKKEPKKRFFFLLKKYLLNPLSVLIFLIAAILSIIATVKSW